MKKKLVFQVSPIEHKFTAQFQAKTLQRQLAEKEAALEEETARVKSITDRMNQLRQELNQSKSQNMNHQRVVDDLQLRHQAELNNVNAKLKDSSQYVEHNTNVIAQLQQQVITQ